MEVTTLDIATLYLIPAPLYEGEGIPLPERDLAIVRRLDCIIAERAKTARRFLKQYKTEIGFDKMLVEELDKHIPDLQIREMLQPALEGRDIGLMSEAGCPGVADPGAQVVEMAHKMGIRVVPLVGPSSLLLALMASGLNGQQFAFQGYLPIDKHERKQQVNRLEQLVIKSSQTQLFIETPYRNMGLFDDLTSLLHPDSRLCVACMVSSPEEWIATKTVKEWRSSPKPDLDKKPTVFLIGK